MGLGARVGVRVGVRVRVRVGVRVRVRVRRLACMARAAAWRRTAAASSLVDLPKMEETREPAAAPAAPSPAWSWGTLAAPPLAGSCVERRREQVEEREMRGEWRPA